MMMFLFAVCRTYAQQPDSTHQLETILIKGYLSDQQLLQVPSSAAVIQSKQFNIQQGHSLVAAMNTIPGIRMEERTPASYRLSMRGSSLRSPFGVRNVKVYFDEMPLTDAGGNTYLNALDMRSIDRVEVLKGPDGSLFGANSGGVLLIDPVQSNRDSTRIDAGIEGGSYGYIRNHLAFSQQGTRNDFSIKQAYQSSDSYRDHSDMRRHYIQLADRYRYGKGNELKLLGFYSDLRYHTPGGLTLAQFDANPKASRPATATLPGAIEQNIGIHTKMLYGGVVNEAKLNNQLRHVVTVFGSSVRFENPFITNYEERREYTYGARIYLEWTANERINYESKINIGVEWQRTNAGIQNYDNLQGEQGDPQAIDQVNTNQHFFFARYAATIHKRLNVEAALSLNYYRYNFRNIFPLDVKEYSIQSFDPQWMPRIALSYTITNQFVWRATVSRGYSTPTIAEVRPTNNIVNTNLQSETGWNYETGFRFRNQRLSFDVSGYYLRMTNSIVNQRLPNETDYFINAGGTNLLGAEVAIDIWIIRPQVNSFVKSLRIDEAITLNHYRFREYSVNNVDYSGKPLTGVPEQVVVSGLQLEMRHDLSFFLQHNYTARLPLNYAASVYAKSYHLVQVRLGWELPLKKTRISIYVGGDNLLNQRYSLGNDLNAVGNRYYNPAAKRNYYAGVRLLM